MIEFERSVERMPRIQQILDMYGLESLTNSRDLCNKHGFDPFDIVKETQTIAFDDAAWAYTLGAAIAIKQQKFKAYEAANAIGEGLQAFTIPGSVAEQRKVGLGHGNLASRLLSEESRCFCFLAGHESFAAAEGAIKIAQNANKVRQSPLRVILNGLGNDAA